MLLSPILIRLSLAREARLTAAILSYGGYVWMGALFMFFSIHLVMDLYHGFGYIASRIISPSLLRFIPGKGLGFSIALVLVTVIVVYGIFEANRIRVERVVLRTDKLPRDVNSLRIAQISDVHFSPIVGERMARKIVKAIEKIRPDILVSTGDLIDDGLREKGKVAALFKGLKVPYGKYAVMGNHEFYTGISESVAFTESAGFRMLRDEGTIAGEMVNIVGVDDPTAGRFGINRPSETDILKTFSNGKLTVLLKHQPAIKTESEPGFDLQLSGHTHGGQIFPFGLISSRFFPYQNGLYRVGKEAQLYVTRGTGTWGPPIRFLSPPEITVISFYPLL